MTAVSYEDIRRRLAEATGPDRELDHLIHSVLVEPVGTIIRNPKRFGGAFICADVTAPSYTASLDAALALVKEKLPGWSWNISKIAGVPTRTIKDCEARIWLPSYLAELPNAKRWPVESSFTDAATPALAVLSALFAALEASHD